MSDIDVRAVAIRFADLWAIDPHQMVDEIYADDIVMENMSSPSRVIEGAAQLHAVEDELAARIPEHRHELIRVIVDGPTACLETTVVAPLTGEYAPACVWWWLDATAKVSAEVGWFDWSVRNTDSRASHGTVPPNLGAAGRDRGWHAAMATAYAQGWADDPVGSARSLFAPDCRFGHVGREERVGVEALVVARQLECDALPVATRRMEIQRVIGEGSVLALLVAIGDDERSTRGTVVLTFDRHDRIVSERSYLDWRRAVERTAPANGRPIVGSRDWTPRG